MEQSEPREVVLTARLNAQQRSALDALGGNGDDGLAALAGVALSEWLDWLAAEDRPASLTELAKRRVKALLGAGLLPTLPTAPVVAQRVRLTLGQARYVVSTLALENPGASAEARDGLAGRLRAKLLEANVPEPDGLDAAGIEELSRIESELRFDAPKSEGVLALAVHEELLSERFATSHELNIDRFQAPRVKRRTDSYVAIELRPHVAGAILARLRGRRL